MAAKKKPQGRKKVEPEARMKQRLQVYMTPEDKAKVEKYIDKHTDFDSASQMARLLLMQAVREKWSVIPTVKTVGHLE